MAYKRKKTSWSKFEYVFRSVVPQERKGNVVLCYYVHRPVTFQVTQKTHDKVWSLDSYSCICVRSTEVLSCTNTAALPWNELTTGAIMRSWRKCRGALLSGSSWQNPLQSRDAFQGRWRYLSQHWTLLSVSMATFQTLIRSCGWLPDLEPLCKWAHY